MRRLIRPSIPVTLLFGNNPTTIDAPAAAYNGFLMGVAVTVPVLDSGTATLNIKDADGNIIKAITGLAANQTTFTPLTGTNAIPLCGNIVFEIVTSASQTANRIFAIKPTIDSLLTL